MLGQLATEYVIDLIERPGTPVYPRVLPPKLIVRESTRRLKK